jgi:hypothetical protein
MGAFDMNTQALVRYQVQEDAAAARDQAIELNAPYLEQQIREAITAGEVDEVIAGPFGETTLAVTDVFADVDFKHYENRFEAMACLMAYRRGDKDAQARCDRLIQHLTDELMKHTKEFA